MGLISPSASCTLPFSMALKCMKHHPECSTVTGIPSFTKETKVAHIQHASHSPFQLVQTLAVMPTDTSSSVLSAHGHGIPSCECRSHLAPVWSPGFSAKWKESEQLHFVHVVSKMMALPKDVHTLIPRTCEYVTLNGKRDFCTHYWGEGSRNREGDYSGRFNLITRVLKS
jgi:hypothetical protein